MKISTDKPFKVVYSLYQHEYLGYLFESFVVQLDDQQRLTLLHQNISAQNANEFASELDENDYEVIDIIDSMNQHAVIRHFNGKKMKPADFFTKIYGNKDQNKLIIDEIHSYLERRRAKVLPLLCGKLVFEMGSDGEPTWKQLQISENKATVLFHFRKNEENTHYFPTIKYEGVKLEFQCSNCYIICKEPAWMVCNDKIFTFEKEVDGHKLQPFLHKKFIVVPQKMEEVYYKKFIAPLVASFDVYAKGFEIISERFEPKPVITLTEMAIAKQHSLAIFGDDEVQEEEAEKNMLFDLNFHYGGFSFRADHLVPVSVSVEKGGDGNYVFHRLYRDLEYEKSIINKLRSFSLPLKHSKAYLKKNEAVSWLTLNAYNLNKEGIEVRQSNKNEKTYFLGEYSLDIQIKENIDWFDIYAIIKFGPYEISFRELRKIILRKGNEITLPNGEVAIIPKHWIDQYSEFFAFLDERKDNQNLYLKKHHLALVEELEKGDLAQVVMDRKLQKLRSFENIEDFPMPENFNGELRPYQKAGYNWLQFLHQFKFGGCLADDMGLGKTVQTLAMLQSQKERGVPNASLLVMPTSLVYNWEKEAQKFTPGLKIFNYTGTNRMKDPEQFAGYDLILTSYGIIRLDVEILQKYYFNYIILDESQAIKNPGSNIAKAVKKLKSKFKLILTGTPLENSTLDLWSQMTFVNPGLLGSQSFFKNEFLMPIEKKKDELKTNKLNAIIKPFILRRHKSQVATELPEKVINVQYCSMTTMQEEKYEEVKSQFRNKIIDEIDQKGLKQAQFLLLQGLTKLRQLANHPRMVDHDYPGDSGKMEDVISMLTNAISEKHKILVFSQFVKHLALVREYLDANRLNYVYLDGSTKDRQGAIERFQNDPSVSTFLISLKAGGLGLNLTKADYVFLLDPWWNPAVESQAIDRAHRIGQKNTVFTYKFISKNTVEEKILALQEKKIHLASELITTEESFVKELTRKDIESLFD
ncbi:MAG: SNF2-related protein [Cyclobacteriaceae bacterium]